MRTPRSAVGALTGATALALALVATPTSAAAPGNAPDGVASHAAARTVDQQQAVVDYWTPERMKNATPRGQKVDPAKGKPVKAAAAEAVQVPVQPELGKVFFTLGGSNYVCSGTATDSANGDVVTTAGHCLNEGPGAYATNFAFVPAYDNDSRPYGTWTAETLLTPSAWANSGDYNHDVGFAVMNENASGQSLTDVVGSYPIGFDLGYNRTFEAYGYPAASPYDGQDLWQCSGTAGVDTRGTTDHRLPCSMTGGSSGGGWITDGTLNSVNSFGYRGETDVMYGPYFGSVEEDVYTTAASS
ncbi:trypsin-like serine peptidase [Phycicoccus avicenniae]|nr:hypothetical protein [Phycicoccus avicenniae]